ncbi:uncharacterized protein LOC133525059 isoform X2 [Cydia pomonella]|uniref:uncharacterized protein LOC133525059 isoform X2 n=1 Tax=Cydia pomonella TaxID=82600 RepID=UPI002ADD78F9|nr:uncharacterized protein LOC133525059 isoform X2 [Cydia pomonella]
MGACAKFIVILLIMSNVNTEAEKNQTHAKRDTSRIDRPQTKSDDMVKGTYRIIDNEISKTDDTNKRDSSETETQTSVTLIFLNASYKTEVTTLETQNSEENSSTEEKKTVQPTSLVQEQTTNNLVSKKPYSKPTRKEPCQRGILDLLLPAERVQIFKSYFNSFKRFLSATF